MSLMNHIVSENIPGISAAMILYGEMPTAEHIKTAMHKDSQQMLTLLLEHGGKATDGHILISLNRKSPQMLRILLEHGGKPTDLHIQIARIMDYQEILNLLLAYRSVPTAENNSSMPTRIRNLPQEPAINGAQRRISEQTSLFNPLLQEGWTRTVIADPIQASIPLMQAIRLKNLPAIMELIQNGEVPTAEHIQVTINIYNLQALLIFLKHGGVVTAEHIQTSINMNSPQILGILLEHGGQPTAKHIQTSIDMDSSCILQTLLEHGGQPTAAHIQSAKNRNRPAMQRTLESFVEPLMSYIVLGNIAEIRAVILNGKMPTAEHIKTAIIMNNPLVLIVLLENGGKPTAKHINLTIDIGRQRMVALLLKYGGEPTAEHIRYATILNRHQMVMMLRENRSASSTDSLGPSLSSHLEQFENENPHNDEPISHVSEASDLSDSIVDSNLISEQEQNRPVNPAHVGIFSSTASPAPQCLQISTINAVQKNIIEATLSFVFDEINERVKPSDEEEKPSMTADDAIKVLDAIISDTISENEIKELEELTVWDSIKQMRDILEHLCPQNRSESYPYVGQEKGFAMFKMDNSRIDKMSLRGDIYLKNGRFIEEEHIVYMGEDESGYFIAKEPFGLLGLTAREDNFTRPISKQIVVDTIHKLVNEEINKYRPNNVINPMALI